MTSKSTKGSAKKQIAASLRVGEECACFNVRKLSRAITRAYDHHLSPTGLRITQFTILNAVSVAGRANLNQIADALVMDRSTLGRNIRPLIKSGLIESAVDDNDGRAQVLSLTKKGRVELAAALPYWRQAQQHLDHRLGAMDLLSLVRNWGEIEATLNAT